MRPDLGRFIWRCEGNKREDRPGEFVGDADIRSSGWGSSSSAFLFRLVEALMANVTRETNLVRFSFNSYTTYLGEKVRGGHCRVDVEEAALP